jgi:hypothetical protein
MYLAGQGVHRDYVQAHMWFTLADSTHTTRDSNADARDAVAAKMTPAQIEETQHLASEWTPK